jgi:hypothetical protein
MKCDKRNSGVYLTLNLKLKLHLLTAIFLRRIVSRLYFNKQSFAPAALLLR